MNERTCICARLTSRPAERMLLVTMTPFDSLGQLKWERKDVIWEENCDEADINWGDGLPNVEDYVVMRVSLRRPPQPVVTKELMDAAEEFLSDLWQELQSGGEPASTQQTGI